MLDFILVFALASEVFPQAKPVKIIFDVSSADPAVHESTLRHVTEMAKNYPDSKFEVVLYGGSIAMVQNEKSTVSGEIRVLASNKNVSFVICEQTMKRKNVASAQMIPGVIIVPDGILEIIQKQQEGW